MVDTHISRPAVSIVIPIGKRHDDLGDLLKDYAGALKGAGQDFEIIAVVDGPRQQAMAALTDLAQSHDWLRVIELSREFGESAALTAGFSVGRGDIFVTLPAYYQVDPAELPKLIEVAGDRDDVLIAVRWPRAGSSFERTRRNVFHGLLRFITGMNYRDLGCNVRLLKRKVTEETPLYGEQHRFLPALASRQGFRVREVELKQSPKDRFRGRYRFREYLHRLLDILTVFFLIRFTKKPLRFFGMIGTIVGAVGALLVSVMVVQRLFFGVALADRPALLLSSLLVVLGVQIFALGLIGELIIFTHAGQMKEYAIRSIIDSSGVREPDKDAA
jgi:glycosyltransferase involved in cell wall biosynthesis